MAKKKLIKVIFEYEDEIHYIEDEEARRWESAANGVITFNHVHGISFPQFDWKKIKKETANADK